MPRATASDLCRAWATKAEAQVERTSARLSAPSQPVLPAEPAACHGGSPATRLPKTSAFYRSLPAGALASNGPRLHQANHTMGGILR